MFGKRIAVVGAGAAGLTCAWRLARWGFGVALFEAAPRLGGVLADLAPGRLRFPLAAPYLSQLIRRGAVAQAHLAPLPLHCPKELRSWRRWPLAWWQLVRWGKRFPDQPLGAWPEYETSPLTAWLTAVTETWTGAPLASLTWRHFAPFARLLFWSKTPFGCEVVEPASEWLAVALARAIGRMGHPVHVATAVIALEYQSTCWQVHAAGLAPWQADALVLALPPAAAALLLPAGAIGSRLDSWPNQPLWGVPQPQPKAVAEPVVVAPRCWLAAAWLPPQGALPGLDGAVGSGWTTARAVRAALIS